MCEIEGRTGKITDEKRAEYEEAFNAVSIYRQ
jgi:hypothetical protein